MYAEPFFGSGGIYFGCPYGPRPKEIINDLDCYVANFYRSMQQDYENLAKLTDYPTISADMKARRHWLRENRSTVQKLMDFNPEFYDTKIAAWWCYVVTNSILISGSVSLLPDDYEKIIVPNTLDELMEFDGEIEYPAKFDSARPEAGPRKGIHSKKFSIHSCPYCRCAEDNGVLDGTRLLKPFTRIGRRLANCIILNQDWEKALNPTILCTTKSYSDKLKIGVFLDPPYGVGSAGERQERLYAYDTVTLIQKVQNKAIELSEDPRIRIAVCGFDTDYESWPDGWEMVPWKRRGGMEKSGKTDIARQEVIWFSPSCIKPKNEAVFA